MANIEIIKMNKEKANLFCYTNDGRYYRIDFSEGSIYGINNKKLSSTKSIYEKIPNVAIFPFHYVETLCFLTQDRHFCNYPYMHLIESMLSYPELWEINTTQNCFINYILENYKGELPSGYVSYCFKRHLSFCESSILLFETFQKTKDFPEVLREKIDLLYLKLRINLASELSHDIKKCSKMIKIFDNSLKKYEVVSLGYIFEQLITKLHEVPSAFDYINLSKTVSENLKIISQYLDKEKEAKLTEREALLLPIDEQIFSEFVVKIPLSFQELESEGTQQHNCVGHFYNDSIIRGENLIYFLRLKDTPEKSCVTCRFSMEERKTVEHRTFANKWYEDKSLFEEIDNTIIKILDEAAQ